MKKLLLILLCMPMIGFGQIINIINFNDSTNYGWSGSTELEYDYNKSTDIDMEIINTSSLQWNNEFWTIFFLNEIDFNRGGNIDFANDAIQHLRLSYHVTDKYTIESFVQNHYDLVKNIENRKSVSLGMRTKIPILQIIGFNALYEHENLTYGQSNKDYRFQADNYISFKISEKLKVSNSVSYQLKIEDISDYRLEIDAAISALLFKNFFLTNSFSLAHDTHPAYDTPNTTYQIKNSLTYEF